jgi:hypothetical protein
LDPHRISDTARVFFVVRLEDAPAIHPLVVTSMGDLPNDLDGNGLVHFGGHDTSGEDTATGGCGLRRSHLSSEKAQRTLLATGNAPGKSESEKTNKTNNGVVERVSYS